MGSMLEQELDRRTNGGTPSLAVGIVINNIDAIAEGKIQAKGPGNHVSGTNQVHISHGPVVGWIELIIGGHSGICAIWIAGGQVCHDADAQEFHRPVAQVCIEYIGIVVLPFGVDGIAIGVAQIE